MRRLAAAFTIGSWPVSPVYSPWQLKMYVELLADAAL